MSRSSSPTCRLDNKGILFRESDFFVVLLRYKITHTKGPINSTITERSTAGKDIGTSKGNCQVGGVAVRELKTDTEALRTPKSPTHEKCN
jgi:hypothetical protein